MHDSFLTWARRVSYEVTEMAHEAYISKREVRDLKSHLPLESAWATPASNRENMTFPSCSPQDIRLPGLHTAKHGCLQLHLLITSGGACVSKQVNAAQIKVAIYHLEQASQNEALQTLQPRQKNLMLPLPALCQDTARQLKGILMALSTSISKRLLHPRLFSPHASLAAGHRDKKEHVASEAEPL